jgi:hypothetical protein
VQAVGLQPRRTQDGAPILYERHRPELKIIAAILERLVIDKILTHLGLDPQPPPRAPARERWQVFPA